MSTAVATSTAAPSKWMTLLAVCLGLAMLVIDLFIVIVALPAIGRNLQAELSLVEWIISAYALMLGVLPLAMGRLGDILGRRKIYFFGLAVFIAASLACGAAQNIYQLIAFRVVQGIGAAIMQPATLAIVTGAFPAHQRGLAIGIWGGISGFGLIAGPVLGGLLVRGDDWRWIFFINGPIGVAAVVMALLFVSESRDESMPQKIDWPGVVLLSGALTLFLFGLTRANAAGWTSPLILGCLGASVIVLCAFVAIERRTEYPLVDFSLFQNSTFVAACLNTFFFTGAVFGAMPYLSLFMQNYWGMSAFESGLAFLPATGVAVLTTPLGGLLGQRLGSRLNILIAAASAVTALGGLYLTRLNTQSTYSDGLLPALLFLGAAVGMLMSTSGFAVMSAAPSAKRGLAAGTWTMARNVGPAMGIAVLGTVFLQYISGEIPRELSNLPQAQVSEIMAAADHFLVAAPPGAQDVVSNVVVQGLVRIALVISIMCVLAARISAQPPGAQPPADPAAVERGQQLLAAECGFCHGSNARGGSSGPDLTRSALVQEDENGRQLGEFLRVGRPDRGMPKFDQLSAAQIADLAAYLHDTIRVAINRGSYKILDILVGDPKAGEAFFNGAGRCASCHSPAQDLRGIGSKYDPPVLQGRIVMPRGRPGGPGAGPPAPPYLESTAIKATVTTDTSDSATGAIVRLTDFDVLLYEPATGRMRSWLRRGDTPKVVVTDPLQAHVDMLTKWTDADMHNVTAYLASLK